MNTSIINFDYKGNQISFERGNDVMVNLTAMAKPYPNKNLTNIINSQEIRDYCNSLTKLQNYSLADLLIVKRGGDNPGTWAHRLVAIRVAQKLNSDLAVWVDMKIEELMRTGVTTVSNDDEAIAYAMQVLNKRLEQARQEKAMLEQQAEQQQAMIDLQDREIKQSAPKVKYYDDCLQSVNTLTTTQVAKQIGLDAEKLHRKLKEIGVIYRQSGQWLLHSPYSTWGLHATRTQTYTRSDGSTGTSIYTVWTEKGRRFIIALYQEGFDLKKAVKQL
jgi:phage antirepressor YoqD-like protein